MGVVNYYSVGGQLQGEQAVGGARVYYLTDALGSVTGTVQQTGAGAATLQNTYHYKPYGQTLAKTGGAPDPAFLWVGEHGYRQTGRDYSDVYVRARHYGSGQGAWTTKARLVDFLDGEPFYCYAMNNPVMLIDPLWLYPKVICPSDPSHEAQLGNAVSKVCDALIAAGKFGLNSTKCLNQPDQSQCMIDWCNHTKSTVSCGNTEICNTRTEAGGAKCAYSYGASGAGHSVYICPIAFTDPGCNLTACDSLVECILHEVAGLCGSPHEGGGKKFKDPCDFRANCLCDNVTGLGGTKSNH